MAVRKLTEELLVLYRKQHRVSQKVGDNFHKKRFNACISVYHRYHQIMALLAPPLEVGKSELLS